MPAIPMTSDTLKGVKRAIAHQYPQLQSAHVTEAIAYGLGYRTHAAMKSRLDLRHPLDPDYGYFDMQRFVERARELSGKDEVYLYNLTLANIAPYGVLATYTKDTAPVDLRSSLRRRAWRNAMVLAINGGIEQRHFTIRRGDNRWDAPIVDGRRDSGVYHFDASGIPGIAAVTDAGWDELAIHVALWPTSEAERRVTAANAGFLAGDLFATGWLERRKGAWLQISEDVATGWSFSSRKHCLRPVSEIDIHPAGYSDHGPFII